MQEYNVFVTTNCLLDFGDAMHRRYEYTKESPRPLAKEILEATAKLQTLAGSLRDEFEFSDIRSISVGKNDHKLYYRIDKNEIDVVGFVFLKPKYENRFKFIMLERLKDLESGNVQLIEIDNLSSLLDKSLTEVSDAS